MYKSLVIPHLAYDVQALSLHQIGHIRLIEGVQRRLIRFIPELKSLPYEARLKRLDLTTLEIRIIRGDLIEVYTTLNGIEKINPDSLFTRQRVIDYWNALPQTAIDAENINHFKDQLFLTPTLLLKLIPSAQPLLLYLEFTVPQF